MMTVTTTMFPGCWMTDPEPEGRLLHEYRNH